MKNLITLLVTLIFASPSAHAILDNTARQWTLGANYNLSLQNPFGDIPISNVNFNFTPSVIFNDTHETGINIGFSLNRTNNTITSVITKTSTFNFGPYYRYNFLLNNKDAAVPIMAYFGPQFGLSSISTPVSSTSNLSVGGQVGLNFMFSKNLALNVHVFQFDTVFDTLTQLFITQSVGVRYYFQ